MVASDEEVTVAKGKEKVEETSKVQVATEEERGTSTYAAAAAPTGDGTREQPVDNSLTSNLAALIAELREARVDAARQAKEDRESLAALLRAAKQPSEESSTSPAAHPLASHYAVGLPHNLFGNDKSTATSWEPRLLALDQDLPARLIRDKSGPKAQREYHTLVAHIGVQRGAAASHAARHGAATAAACLNIPDRKICYYGGWAADSAALKRYIHMGVLPDAAARHYFEWMLWTGDQFAGLNNTTEVVPTP